MQRFFTSRSGMLRLGLFLAASGSLLAQADPWTASSANLEAAFTGPIVTSLMAVAIVVGGLMFAYSEGQGKRTLAGIIFGGGMSMGAVRFMQWLYT